MSQTPPRNPDAWRHVHELFHLALERQDSERLRFLDEACGGDTVLRAEVTSLLQAHTRASQFLESPASSGSPASSPADPGALVGRDVGQYRIERMLGRGGMGVVYLAHDQRLGRRVALKAISPDFTHDASRRERLRREARAAASLAHPGIATIYALEEFGDQVFIAGEYVAGETLREEIARGPGSPGTTLNTAIDLATALAAAHDRGIIHRDLKPENVIRTPGGQVKILDFGLAQIRSSSADAARLTDDGTVLGTPAYMAPEQIRRDACDARTDLFSLGIVLAEFMTGSHPFAGSDAASTIARILEADPSFTPSAPSSPDGSLAGALDSIIRTCLRKSPDARFQSAHALLSALEQARSGHWRSTAIPAIPDAQPMRWWQFHQAATCVAYAALMMALWWAQPSVGGRVGLQVFVGGLVAAVTASILRLHLWFAASSLPEEWQTQHQRSRPWIRAADSAFAAILMGTGLWVLEASPVVAAVLVGAAVAVFLSFSFIEPATTRAAFRHR